MGTEHYRTPAHARFLQLKEAGGFDSADQVAEFLGLDKSTISRYLSDDPKQHRDPRPQVLELFEHKLGNKTAEPRAEMQEAAHPYRTEEARRLDELKESDPERFQAIKYIIDGSNSAPARARKRLVKSAASTARNVSPARKPKQKADGHSE